MDEIVEFESGKEFERWLSKHHTTSTGVWLRMFRKKAEGKHINGAEALDAALCYGWITGQARSYDEISCLWRFCPRRPKSIWSKINIGHAERLIREGRMRPAGLRQIEEAKADGRWENAYEPQRKAKLPRDFIVAVNKNEKAKKFLKTLNRSNTYAIIFRLHHTRDKARRKAKIEAMVKMLEENKKYH